LFFFRETVFFLKIKNPQNENILGIFIKLKVTIQGSIHSESGMILNLKDLDFALDAVKKNFSVQPSKKVAFAKLYNQLQNLLGDYFYSLELSWDQRSFYKSKTQSYNTLKTQRYFQEADGFVKREVLVKFRNKKIFETRISHPELGGHRIL